MNIRRLESSDDRMAVSHIYEESWKYAYKDLLPQEYLDGIQKGHWSGKLDEKGLATLLLMDGGKYAGVCGFCQSRFPQFEGCGEIVSIYLLPEYMGKGHGKALFEEAVVQLKKQGFSKIFLWVLEGNERAIRFYEKAGFVKGEPFLQDNIGGKDVKEISYWRRL